MTLEKALAGKEIPEEIRRELALVELSYIGFDGLSHQGRLVLHKELVEDAIQIFAELAARRFPIERIEPVVAYGWDDDASMAANNTSAFNYRMNVHTPTKLSSHALGRAIDLNPALNPFIKGDRILPPGATYDIRVLGTVTEEVADLFKKRGWKWGGDWQDRKDWQHFEKPA